MAENNKSMDKGRKTTDRFYYCTAPAYRRRLHFLEFIILPSIFFPAHR